MGKSRPKRSVKRPNPIGNELIKESITHQEGDESVDETVLENIVSNLLSGSANDRECGCASFAMFAAKDHKEILDKKLVKMVAPLMIDSSLSVRHRAVGALRDLSVVSGDVCDEMVSQDVMTPLCTLLTSHYGDGTWETKAKEVQKFCGIDTKKEIFVEAITLLWTICEANTTALSIFNNNNLIQNLFYYLNMEKYGPDVVSTVLQCIYSVSEDNPPAIDAIKEKEAIFNGLMSTSNSEDSSSSLYVRVLTCGVILNVTPVVSTSTSLSTVLETLHKVLVQDQRKMVHDYTSHIPVEIYTGKERKDGVDQEMAMEMDGDSKIDKVEEEMKSKLNEVLLGQQTAIEILTNLCCDEGDDDWEDEDLSDMSDDNVSYGDVSNGGGVIEEKEVTSVPTVVLEAITKFDLVKVVLSKADFPAENACQILKSQRMGGRSNGPMILKMLSTLRSRAFLCLNNLISVLSVEDLGGLDDLFQVWTKLGNLCFNKSGNGVDSEEEGSDLVEAATSAMRAVTQKLVDTKSVKHFSTLTEEDVKKMFEFGASAESPIVRMNIVQIVGCIGVLSSSEKEFGLSKVIAEYLIIASLKDADLRVVAESIDKLIDMFSEDYTDGLCVEMKLVEKLKQILPGLRVKIGVLKKKKGSSAEVKGVIGVARTNLLSFIKYKEKRISP